MFCVVIVKVSTTCTEHAFNKLCVPLIIEDKKYSTRAIPSRGTMEPFGWNYKPAEKHYWLIFCERKILFRLKNKLNKTDYKPDEHGL
jgi:hypothetical protein